MFLCGIKGLETPFQLVDLTPHFLCVLGVLAFFRHKFLVFLDALCIGLSELLRLLAKTIHDLLCLCRITGDDNLGFL